MGRVSKYKRIKSVDPFSKSRGAGYVGIGQKSHSGKKNKSEKGRRARDTEPRLSELAYADDPVFAPFQHVAAAPSDGNDKMLNKNNNNNKNNKKKGGKKGNGDVGDAVKVHGSKKNEKVELRLSWMPKTNKSAKKQTKNDKDTGLTTPATASAEGSPASSLVNTRIVGKRENESFRQFANRIDKESREAVLSINKKMAGETKSAKKRKQWFKEKRARKTKKRKRGGAGDDADDDDGSNSSGSSGGSSSSEFDVKQDVVQFGEVALAPPSLPLPKKGHHHTKVMRSQLMNEHIQGQATATDPSLAAAEATKNFTNLIRGHNKASLAHSEFSSLSVAELAQRARNAYKDMKKKRKLEQL